MSEPTAAGTVKMQSLTGQYVDVPESEVAEKTGRGYRPVGMSEAREHREALEDAKPAALALSAATGAARGLTFGASDVVIPELAGGISEGLGGRSAEQVADYTRQRMLGLQERNAGLSMAGELAGAVVSPLSRLAGAGEAAAARGLGGSAAARFAAGAGRAAAEGAAYGAGSELGRAALEEQLGDPALVAERVVGGMGRGALFGAGAHAGMSALGVAGKLARSRFSGRPSTADATALVKATEPGLIGKWLKETRRIVTGVDDEASRAASEAIHGRATVARDTAKVDLTRHLTEDLADSGHLRRLHQEAKPEAIARLVRRGEGATMPQATQAWAAVDSLDAAFRKIEELKAAGDNLSYSKPANALRKRLDLFRREITEAAHSHDNQALHTLTDRIKRMGDAAIKQGESTAGKSGDLGSFNLAKHLQDPVDSIRAGLEDVATWGDAGAFQREINAAYREQAGKQSSFSKHFLAEHGNDALRAYHSQVVADPSKVGGFVGKLGDAENALAEDALQNYLSTTGRAAEAALRHGVVDGPAASALRRMLERRKGLLRDVIESGSAANKSIRAAEKLEAKESGAALGRGLLGSAALAAGFASDETPWGLMGLAALAYVGKPYTQAKMVAKLAGYAERAAKSEFGAVASLGKRAQRFAERLSPHMVELQSAAAAARPEVVERTAAQLLGDVGSAAPAVSSEFRSAAARVAAVLAARNPIAASTNPLGPQPTPSHSERVAFMDALEVVKDVPAALDKLISGDLTLDQAETLRAAYPAVWDDFSSRVVEQLTTDAAEGRFLPYDERLRLGMLLGLPLDPLLEPDQMQAVQSIYGPDQTQQQPQGPLASLPKHAMPQRSKPARTGSEKTESETELE